MRYMQTLCIHLFLLCNLLLFYFAICGLMTTRLNELLHNNNNNNNNKSAQSNLGTGPRRGTSARGRAAIKARGYVMYVLYL